jgi:hypothetical protein
MNDKVKPGKLEKIARAAKEHKPSGRINVDDLRKAAKRLGYKLTKKKD